jgi:hypothetical protein
VGLNRCKDYRVIQLYHYTYGGLCCDVCRNVFKGFAV